MSPEQLVAILGGLAGVIIAMALLVQRIGELRKDLNGRLEQLLEQTRAAAQREGELAGRDWAGSPLGRRLGDPPAPPAF